MMDKIFLHPGNLDRVYATYVPMTGNSGEQKKMPKPGRVVCPVAEAQALLNKLKTEEYVGPAAPPRLKVRV